MINYFHACNRITQLPKSLLALTLHQKSFMIKNLENPVEKGRNSNTQHLFSFLFLPFRTNIITLTLYHTIPAFNNPQ